jgi:hypothetical protein
LNRSFGGRPLWKAALTVAVAALLAVVADHSQGARSAPVQTACGSELWALKTLSDPLRRRVNLRPRATTIAAINARRMPARAPRRRDAFERQVWRVSAQIVEYRLEDDQDIDLVLYGGGSYLIAEMPAAACLPRRTRNRPAIVRVRRMFESRCGAATDSWHQLGAVAYVSGVGFWDFPHGQSGAARNYAELHPVTGMRLLNGC